MLRHLLLLLLVAGVPFVSAAAPAPPENDTARMRRIYGEADDPDKDCTFAMKGDALRIGIPAVPHFLTRWGRIRNAPRVWREVEGDFTAIVRVSYPIRTVLPEPSTERSGLACAGLVGWAEDGENVWVMRDEQPFQGAPREIINARGIHRLGDRAGGAGSAFLRLTRVGPWVSTSDSRDGKKWKELGRHKLGWGRTVRVGVVAENGYDAPFAATFDQYNLTQPMK